MQKQTGFFDDTNKIAINQIGDGDCLLEFASDRFLLTYEAAYDLAIRLALFVQKVDNQEFEDLPTTLN